MVIPMRYVLLTCLMAVVVPTVAWAVVDFDMPPIVLNNGDKPAVTHTPLLKKSDVVRYPIKVHYPHGIGGPFDGFSIETGSDEPTNVTDGGTQIKDRFGFAGYLVRVHILDGSEVNHDPSPFVPIKGFGAGHIDLQGIYPGLNIPNSRKASSSRTGAIWLPDDVAGQSGVALPASFQADVIDFLIHAKNTDMPNDRTPDIELQVYNIRHAKTKGPVDVLTSSWVFVPDASLQSGNVPDPLPSALQPKVHPSTGHWVHLSESKVFDIGPSAYIATLAGTALVDIRHIPEPASGLMIIGGISAIVLGLRSRKNRVG
jgi:hypothetical protein